MSIGEISLGVIFLSLLIWVGLICFWGQFWRTDQLLSEQPNDLKNLPVICAVIPARNEAEMLPFSMRSLLTQNYPGCLSVVLVDDHSSDGTATVAAHVAKELNKSNQLHIVSAEPLPSGWSGKLWAMEQGIRYAQTLTPPDYFLLTDADIEHDANNLKRLVAKAEQENLDLVSLMVLLRTKSFWEKLLIPAFVFFFQKLYPFRLVNDPKSSIAAAAGGCILIRRNTLTRIGGIEVLRQALIDDCTLAQAVKGTRGRGDAGTRGIEIDKEDLIDNLTPDTRHPTPNTRNPTPYTLHPTPYTQGKIWLGLTQSTRSLRPYDNISTIWDMVARTAFTQLNYSPLLLAGTVIGMALVYLVAPIAAIAGGLTGNWLVAIAGLSTWVLMTFAYLPMVRFYQLSPLWAVCLPAIGLLYTLMTIDSALRHWQGRGGAWKGRVYKDNNQIIPN